MPESTSLQIQATGRGEGVVQKGTQIQPFYFHRDTKQVSVWVNGKQYVRAIEVNSRGGRQSGAQSGPASDKLNAPMPGTVLKILVKQGDTVTTNQALIVMESMKMELTLNSSMDGTVKHIQCEENQLVGVGDLLIQLEPEKTGE